MNVLHIGWQFKPWWIGGHTEYTDSLLSAQVARGYKVSYLSAGRYYRRFKAARLIKWRAGGISIYEIFNIPSAVMSGKRVIAPGSDIEDRAREDILRKTIEEAAPDIVHIHHLLGFPSSFMDIIKDEYHLPLAMTIHDYYMLCPRITLFDGDQNNCRDRDIGRKCADCLRRRPFAVRLHVVRTFIGILSYGLYAALIRMYRQFKGIRRRVMGGPRGHDAPQAAPCQDTEALAAAGYFQRRRDINLERLRRADALICPSRRAREIIEYFLSPDTGPDMPVIGHALAHMERIAPRRITAVSLPIKFVILQGSASLEKGAQVAGEAIALLNAQGYSGKYEVHIYGNLAPESAGMGTLKEKNVFYHGEYEIAGLNRMLAGMHVGIVPSLWEEICGIVGLELLAAGIPIIGSNRGGITEYTIEGVTGIVNKSSSGGELARIMKDIIDRPEFIVSTNEKINKNRGRFIKSMEAHLREIEDGYNRLIAGKKRI